MSPLGVTLTVIDNIEGIDVIRQFTPAPWGSGFSHRSTVSCCYQIPNELDSESYVLIVTSLGNEKLEEKWTKNGIFGSDVLAMNYAYWQVSPFKNDGGVTVGTNIVFVTKMKPNGWVPDIALSRI